MFLNYIKIISLLWTHHVGRWKVQKRDENLKVTRGQDLKHLCPVKGFKTYSALNSV